MNRLAIYGAGGMGRETACVVSRINKKAPDTWHLVGFFDDGIPAGTDTAFGPVLGGIDQINAERTPLAVAIAIGNPQIISRIVQEIINPNISFPNIIDPTTDFMHPESLKIGHGNILCPGCRISCNVEIGHFNILNGDVSLRHDVTLGSCNSLMPGVKVSGGTTLGNRNFFGLASSATQYLNIANDVRVGAGAIVMQNITSAGLYTGIPAQKKK